MFYTGKSSIIHRGLSGKEKLFYLTISKRIRLKIKIIYWGLFR
ncbi:hypothetical protein HMPREF1145_1176 [Oribacterium parvum ACB8]|nr:hypothetical protein HMPREF1145_1176 [Oribacterium parvum ACB8]